MNGLILCKRAQQPGANSLAALAATVTPEQLGQIGQGAATNELWGNALRYAGLGAGVGLTARSLQGIFNQLRRSLVPTRTTRPRATVDIPVAGDDEDEKLASEKQGNGPLQQALNFIMPEPSRAHDIPFSWLPPIGAAAMGTLGGWKGMDVLMDRNRKAELETELARAKQEYEDALAGRSKTAQVLHRELDALYDKLSEDQRKAIEKQASPLATATNIYGLYALLTGVPAAAWAYEATKSKQRSRLLERARRKYQRAREMVRPTPIFARPTPVSPGSSMKSAPDPEEMEGEPLDKAATGLVLRFAVSHS